VVRSHNLLVRPYAREVWQGIQYEHDIHLRRKSFISPRTWVMELLDRGSDVQITTAITAM
jgi:hypothetical protein